MLCYSFDVVRNVSATVLTILCGVLIVYGLVLDCNIAKLGGPSVEPFLLLGFFFLLFINEGYQVALIGVKDVPYTELKETYPYAASIHRLVFEGENKLPRLFLGQSFLVVTSTFFISQLTTFLKFPSIPHVPDWIILIFAKSGFAGVVFTANIIQLLPSILAQKYPSAFLQYTPLLYATIYFAFMIESMGIVYATYAIVYAFELMFFRNKEAPAVTEETPSQLTSATFYVKCTLSVLLTLASAVFICYSIAKDYSIIELPHVVIFAILFFIYILVFYCEGLKIAVISCSQFTREDLVARDLPTKIYDLLERQHEGIACFLLGRQMLVVPAGFAIFQLTCFNTSYGELHNFAYYLLVGLGLPAMLVTMQLVQLAPQVLANRHPKALLNLPGSWALVGLALLVEKVGLTRCAYVLRGAIDFLIDIAYSRSQKLHAMNDVQADVEENQKQDDDTVTLLKK